MEMDTNVTTDQILGTIAFVGTFCFAICIAGIVIHLLDKWKAKHP
jgi:hypothetical protein